MHRKASFSFRNFFVETKSKNFNFHLIVVFLTLAFLSFECQALHIQGTFNPKNDFFRFLAKFGFQKTELRRRDDSQGFIYGNITLLNQNETVNTTQQRVTLAVLDRGYFLEYYGNRTIFDKARACDKMFRKISTAAYDPNCFDQGEEDFLRTVPCPRGQLCPEEDNPMHVVKGYQLTYRIQDLATSRFWYLSLVACRRNPVTCEWEPVSDFDSDIAYDLYLLNGNPEGRNKNMFKLQFSYDNQDLLEVYILLLIVYTILTPLQFYAVNRQKHPISRLLAAALTVQIIALLSITTHFLLFATNGQGVPGLENFGDVLEIFSQSLFMLLLLLLAMGWAVTRQEVACKTALFTLWSLYTLVHLLLYIWKKTEVDVIEDVEEYQTIPGVIILVLRVVVMLCFLLALRETMMHEFSQERLQFFLHFGAASLVWFIYLPLVAIVALQISALWRTKFLTGITYSADTFAYGVLIHLLWPSRTQQYFLLATSVDHTDELEELCQSAKQLHGNSYDADSSSDDDVWLYGENHHKTSSNGNSTATTESQQVQPRLHTAGQSVGFRKHVPRSNQVIVRADINENISNSEKIEKFTKAEEVKSLVSSDSASDLLL